MISMTNFWGKNTMIIPFSDPRHLPSQTGGFMSTRRMSIIHGSLWNNLSPNIPRCAITHLLCLYHIISGRGDNGWLIARQWYHNECQEQIQQSTGNKPLNQSYVCRCRRIAGVITNLNRIGCVIYRHHREGFAVCDVEHLSAHARRDQYAASMYRMPNMYRLSSPITLIATRVRKDQKSRTQPSVLTMILALCSCWQFQQRCYQVEQQNMNVHHAY